MKHSVSFSLWPHRLLLLFALIGFGAGAPAATFTVDRLDDADVNACTASANDCTLRGAVHAANTAPGDDAITFQSGFGGVIQLGSSLTLNSSISVSATTNQNLTVRGGGIGAYSIFIVNNGQTAQFSNLTFSNGNVGFDNNGTVNVSNCTFSGNGGGVLNNGIATLNNCTFSNSNTGNGIFNLETANLNNCTLSGNSVGINNNGGTVNLNNSIVAGNITDVSGSLGTDSNNLKNMTATAAGLDPAGLQDNGGPTPTIALVAGSPAIDAANSSLTTDQRGQTRPYDNPAIENASGGNGSDIGAFEDF